MSDHAGYHGPADPARFDSIDRPTLVIDRARAERNIARMAARAAGAGIRFRPHVKTHNDVAVGEWFRSAGVRAITASSIEYAAIFADAGWDDITIAFPLVTRALPAIAALAARIRLGVFIDNVEAATALAAIETPVDVWVEVDAGYGRTGVAWDDAAGLAAVARAAVATRRHRLRGTATHAGDTYRQPTLAAIEATFRRTAHRVGAARDVLAEATGVPGLEVSVGDTPGCSTTPDFDGVDEIRPGTFVYFDLQQLALGSCAEDDLALAIALPVVGLYPGRGTAVVHGGSVHLSRDMAPPEGEPKSFGRLAVVDPGGWRLLPFDDGHVAGMSQEHGVLRCSPAVLAQLRVGDLAFVIPAHVCLPGNLVGPRVVI